MNQPLVSVIIPTYKSAAFITETLQSVWDQTYKHVEIIVINDGSPDNILDVLATFESKITIITQEHGGIGKARNTGITASKGELIALLDGDDIWLPTKLEEQVHFLEEHPDIQMVFSYAQNSTRPYTKNYQPSSSPFPVIAAHVPSTCLCRRSVFDTVGLFDETGMLGEFADWYSKVVIQKIPMGCIQSLQLLRRLHGNNIGIIDRHRQKDYLYMLKRKLDAERALPRTNS